MDDDLRRRRAAQARQAQTAGQETAARAGWTVLVEEDPRDVRWVLRAADLGIPIDPQLGSRLRSDAPIAAVLVDLAVGRAPTFAGVPLLSEFPESEYDALRASIKRVSVAAGDVVLAEGEVADALYLVAAGRLAALRVEPYGGNIPLGKIKPGCLFGEMAIILGRPRTATVQAIEEVELLRVELKTLRGPTIRSILQGFTQRRMLTNLVNTTSVFRGTNDEARQSLLQSFKPIEVESGTFLVQEGQPGTAFWLVIKGAVEVSKTDGPIERLLARLGPGQVFGEIGLLSGRPAVASVVTTETTRLLRLDRASFCMVCDAHPELATCLADLGQSRLATNRFMLADDSLIGLAS